MADALEMAEDLKSLALEVENGGKRQFSAEYLREIAEELENMHYEILELSYRD